MCRIIGEMSNAPCSSQHTCLDSCQQNILFCLFENEQLSLFISSPKMNPKQITVVTFLPLRSVQIQFMWNCHYKGVSHYLSEWEHWRDILLTGFYPALMSPVLIVMSLISTPVATNEWHSGGSTAQLGRWLWPGSSFTLTATKQVLFPVKALLCIIQRLCFL